MLAPRKATKSMLTLSCAMRGGFYETRTRTQVLHLSMAVALASSVQIAGHPLDGGWQKRCWVVAIGASGRSRW